MGVAIGLPLVGAVVAAWWSWGGNLRWHDLVVLGVLYAITGLGVTVGYHRLFTHRSFTTSRAMRAAFAVLGSMAVQGSPIEWAATHRKHHAFSDVPGDPHTPRSGHSVGWRGVVRGLAHAHLGWMFNGKETANPHRYAPDLMRDHDIRFISRTFLLWVALGLICAFALGTALSGSLRGGLTGLLWGGFVRVFLLHHATFSINSLCHVYGSRPFTTRDGSGNLGWLALLTFGESWHNNHHAFPTSAWHGLRRRQADPGAWLISGLARLHLVWDVVRVPPERQAARRRSGDQPTS
jgi:stearoyl-CoA desaturase (delta-9 desaturase)